MRSNVDYVPARRDIPSVSACMLEIVPARRDIPPWRGGVQKSRGIKLSCICKVKIVYASMDSEGIPARRDISATREHVYRP